MNLVWLRVIPLPSQRALLRCLLYIYIYNWWCVLHVPQLPFFFGPAIPPPLPNLNLRFGFEPFGDPYERKRHVQEKRKREAPLPPNAEGIPRGTYTSTCNGCAVNEEKRLLVCTHCLDQRMNRVDAEIALDVCGDGEIIGNHNGILNCEPDPFLKRWNVGVNRNNLRGVVLLIGMLIFLFFVLTGTTTNGSFRAPAGTTLFPAFSVLNETVSTPAGLIARLGKGAVCCECNLD